MYERTPKLKYNVAARLPKYTTVNGSRSFESRCLIWFMGPIRTEKLERRVSDPEATYLDCGYIPKHNQQTAETE